MNAHVAGAVSGVLAALSLPPFDLWPLAFVALVPITLALSRSEVSRSEAVGAGMAFGVAYYGLLLHWVPFTVAGLIPLGWLIGLLGLGILAGTGGVQGVLLRALSRPFSRGSWHPVLVLPAIWVSTELLLARAGPLAVPWTPLGLALGSVPEIAGAAEWVGVRGLSFWIAAVNGILVVALRSVGLRRTAVVSGLALLAVLAPASAGIVRARTLSTYELPPVLVARMDVSRGVLLDPERRNTEISRLIESLVVANRAALAADGTEEVPALALFPEAPFSTALDGAFRERVGSAARTLGVPIFMGAHVRGERGLENAVVRVDPEGSVRTVHAKRRFVPGVERPGLVAGGAPVVVPTDAGALAFAICFESAFGSDVRRLRRAGAELLVNPTNDGWYAPRPGDRLSAAHAQHRAHLVLRAVETRMGAVRAPLGGELLVVSPSGDLLQPAGSGGSELRSVRPVSSAVTTVFVVVGDLAGILSVVVLVGLLGWTPSRSLRPGGGSAEQWDRA